MPAVPEHVERQRQTWQYRLVKHLRGNQTDLGALVIAILGKAPSHPPRIVSRAVITLTNEVKAFTQARGESDRVVLRSLGTVAELRDGLRRACDEIRLSDAEREEVFSEFRKYIADDKRRETPPDH